VSRIEAMAFAGNPLTAITIGAHVRLEKETFGYEFMRFYNAQGNMAGTYIRPAADSRDWTRKD
jgi:hypothetical protein